MASDEMDLLDQWCAGDRAAGGVLFERHITSLYRFFEHKCEGDVDELVQETFLQCVRSRDQFSRQSSFRTYLFAIARHTLYRYWRRRIGPSAPIDELALVSLSTSIGSRMARREDRARLLAALRDLPFDQQLLLELHYWEEMDREQLAEVFDVESATTRSRLFRARQALRERLDRDPDAQPETDGSDEGFDRWASGLQARANLDEDGQGRRGDGG